MMIMLIDVTMKDMRMIIMLMMIMIISGVAPSVVYGCKEILMIMIMIMKMVCIKNIRLIMMISH